MRRARSFGIVLVLAASLVCAAPNSPRRVRSFARLPDWTGLWETAVSKAITNPSGRTETNGIDTLKLVAHPPFNPEWEQKYQAALADPAARAALANTFKGCGEGAPAYVKSFPNIMEAPMVFQVVVTPEETLFVMDHGEVRHIYTDGRTHPAKDDLWPTSWGDSIGHWEGQTLVIDTIAVNNPPGLGGGEGPVIVAGGGDSDEYALVAVLSGEAHFIERIRMLENDRLEDQMTIMDPKNFTAPWHISRQYRRVSRLNRMVHEDCEGEERNPVVDGRFTLTPPPRSVSGSQK